MPKVSIFNYLTDSEKMPRPLLALWVGLGLSTVAMSFFALDVFGDLVLDRDFPGGRLHRILELIVVVVSVSAFVFHV